MRKRNKQYSRSVFIMFSCIIGTLVIGLVCGYMLAMQGIYEILDHIQIQEVNVNFNETKIIDYVDEIVKMEYNQSCER